MTNQGVQKFIFPNLLYIYGSIEHEHQYFSRKKEREHLCYFLITSFFFVYHILRMFEVSHENALNMHY